MPNVANIILLSVMESAEVLNKSIQRLSAVAHWMTVEKELAAGANHSSTHARHGHDSILNPFPGLCGPPPVRINRRTAEGDTSLAIGRCSHQSQGLSVAYRQPSDRN